ncbi:glycosyltransferase family 2 protein [Ruminococcaceae bacterium OttesenSCG-928-I18]|nr:glycosyltransferase family 2 protein [Ruminococcaceae bacterium OttesenSCG-928-I18]
MKKQAVQGIEGVPDFTLSEFSPKKREYCLLIPVINEGERLKKELQRAKKAGIDQQVDLLICDGGSTDGSTEEELLTHANVRALLTKTGPGKQGAQLRTGIYWALQQGYSGILTIDGNNKDSIEHLPRLLQKLQEGYDFVQGSRFVPGGLALNTPPSRYLAVRLLHAPLTSLAAGQCFTDTTNNFRGYSRAYLTHPGVRPLRDVFSGYELLAYLSTRATQLGFSACEVPVVRAYPKSEPAPTKIKGLRGNSELFRVLVANAMGRYVP